MKVTVASRADLTIRAREPFDEKTAVISITDPDNPEVEFENLPVHLLRQQFDDVSQELYEDFLGRKPGVREMHELDKRFRMFSYQQAKTMAEFILRLPEEVDTIICQCEFGQSRSAAVAAAILEYLNRSGITIFAASGYYPNKLVYNRLYRTLRMCRSRMR